MAMASAIADQWTIIPLLMVFKPNEESSWVKLQCDVNVSTVANPQYKHKKTQVLKFNKLDIELLCCNVHKFYDVADGVLALTTGGSQFEYYRQTLGRMACDTWDAVVAAGDAWPQMVVSFWSCLDVFIGQYIRDTDLEDMQLFLDRSKKPYMMTCVELCSHLRFLNQLMCFFPGANNTAPYDEGHLILMSLNMMPVRCRTQFAVSGQCITDAVFSLDQLVDYMTVLEEASKASHEIKHHNQPNHSRNRGGRNQLPRNQYFGRGHSLYYLHCYLNPQSYNDGGPPQTHQQFDGGWRGGYLRQGNDGAIGRYGGHGNYQARRWGSSYACEAPPVRYGG